MLELLEKQRQVKRRTNATKTGNHFKNGTSSKKGLLLALCILAISSACFAQDVIVTKDSKKINAKVVRINEDNIIYKLYDKQDGLAYSMPKSQIASILYEDGQVETFGSAATQTQAQPQQQQPQQQQPQPQPKKTATNNSTQVTTSQSQAESSASSGSKYKFGVKGGLNSASEYTSDGSTNSRVGIHLGVLMEAAISNKVDIQPELVYSMQGGKSSDNITEKVDYINLPVIFKIYLDQSRAFSIDVGPQFGYMISLKESYKGITLDVYSDSSVNKFDVALCAGVSYKINQKFLINLRYNYGFTKIFSTSDNLNAVVQLGVGYIF